MDDNPSESRTKPLSAPVRGVTMVLSGAIAVRGLAATLYWRDHGNPVFAFGYGVAAFVMALIALSLLFSFFVSEASAFDRFVSQDSPALPTVVGLSLLAAGLYGLIVLTDEHVEIEWTFYGAVAGTGLYILKRTFFWAIDGTMHDQETLSWTCNLTLKSSTSRLLSGQQLSK